MSSFALSVLRRADDSDHGVLKRLLALDGIEEIAKSFGRLVTREDILLQVLLPVLEQLTQPTSGEVSAKARSVLESISNIVGYESIAELYRYVSFEIRVARSAEPHKSMPTGIDALPADCLYGFLGLDAISTSLWTAVLGSSLRGKLLTCCERWLRLSVMMRYLFCPIK
mmetsp:Transcript_27178/g.105820  ORF Transcript_27178/g.105820 Transcript_27178/m.105820 type:complete len:169 (+) Transcript_27178:1733-2239(+)